MLLWWFLFAPARISLRSDSLHSALSIITATGHLALAGTNLLFSAEPLSRSDERLLLSPCAMGAVVLFILLTSGSKNEVAEVAAAVRLGVRNILRVLRIGILAPTLPYLLIVPPRTEAGEAFCSTLNAAAVLYRQAGD